LYWYTKNSCYIPALDLCVIAISKILNGGEFGDKFGGGVFGGVGKTGLSVAAGSCCGTLLMPFGASAVGNTSVSPREKDGFDMKKERKNEFWPARKA
jgi:hypothetical protein